MILGLGFSGYVKQNKTKKSNETDNTLLDNGYCGKN